VTVESVRVIHAIPGRVRLRVRELKDNPALAEALEARLAEVPAIRSVEANPVTASVLVLYRVEHIATPDSLRMLSEALTPMFPGLDVTSLQAAGVPESNGSSHAPLPSGIAGLLGSVNTGVRRATGGVDLKLLVPLALFALGIRSLLVSDRLAFPVWYDFFWFAFGTFLALNPILEAER
jgi:hypothetical protein